MNNCDQRLDSIAAALPKYIFIKPEPFLIWRIVISVGENTRPGDRHTKYLESHLSKQTDVFLVVVVKSIAFKAG